MLNTNTAYLDSFKTASRQLTGKVVCGDLELLPNEYLISFSIERTAPEGKLFGFAVSQKITIKALKVHDIKRGDKIVPSLGIVGEAQSVVLPNFYVDSVEFNKVNQTTTIVGYDILYKAKDINIGSLTFTYPTTVYNYASQVIAALGGSINFSGINFDIINAPNYGGTETLQSVLGALAEFSGTVCYVSQGDQVKFRPLAATSLDKLTPVDYFDLTSGETTTLTQIASASELGNNISIGEEGFVQVLWNNPFFDARDDVDYILNTISENVLGLKSTDYSLSWRGCPAYEIGDCITLREKDGKEFTVYYFNETVEYNGGLKSTSDWKAGDAENVNTSPATLGKTLQQTYAKVDKVSQEIELLAQKIEESDTEALTEEIASLKITTNSITQEVARVESDANTAITTLANRVSNTMTSEDVTILIEQEMGDGVTSITTETGYVFDNTGLTVSKSGSEMTTQITEDGMTVSRNGSVMLTANNTGVDAINLRATTYLIIGDTSRFENYYDSSLGQRTGCFWVGN